VVWFCPLCFEGLLAIGTDLVLVNAVEVLAKGVQSSTFVTNQDLKSSDLVEIERTVIANRNRSQ
jgi:hypothetical protein